MTGSPHSNQTVFVDRNSGGRLFKSWVEKEGIKIVLHDEYFGVGKRHEAAPEDHEWLTVIGKLGWLIVTGDVRTIREPLFLQSLPDSGAHVFLLHDLNGRSPEGKAACIVEAFPKMIGLSHGAERPAIWIMKNGKFSSFDWLDRYQKYVRYKRIPVRAPRL